MIRINVELHGLLAKKADQKQLKLTLDENSMVSDLVSCLKINPEEVGIVIINKKIASFDDLLCDEDRVFLAPFLMGG